MPNPTRYTDENLEKVSQLIRKAAEFELLPRFGKLQPSEIMTKGAGGDVVTVADFESERRIKEGLREIFPNCAIVAEEEASKSPEIMEKLHDPGPVWVIDPLDGTKNFASGKPCFAIIIALIEGGKTTAGWIFDPVAGVMVSATKGGGAWVGGTTDETDKRRVHMPQDMKINQMTVCVGNRTAKHMAGRMAAMANSPKNYVRYSCVGREYIDLALGKINFSHYQGKLMPWDHGADALICREAGGEAFYSSKEGGFDEYLSTAAPADRHLILGPNRGSVGEIHKLLF